MKSSMALRGSAIVFATAILVSAGAAVASAADEPYGDGDVDVTVDITEVLEPGVLALTLQGSSSALTESGSDALTRQFVGSLPTVTVTDTRTAEEVEPGASWYVLGTATDFLGGAGQDTIPAANLGWAPRLTGTTDGEGLVFAGEAVEGSEDGGPGLADRELLFSAVDSEVVAPEGEWSATADLLLRTDADVTPGSYSSTLTLSLFESVEPTP